MAGISGSCGVSESQQLFEKGLEKTEHKRLSDQKLVQQELAEEQPKEQATVTQATEGLKGSLLNTYA